MKENIEAVGLGALNMDHLYLVERILDDGESTVKEKFSSPGGSAANTIYGLARLGIKTGFCGVVGEDDEGETIIDDFVKVGTDTGQIRRITGGKTGSVLCLSDEKGRRSLYVMPGANTMLTGDILNEDYINNAGILHLSSFAGNEQMGVLISLIERLSPDTRLSFAPGTLYVARGLEALAPIMARTHVLFVNVDEITGLTGRDIEAGADICLKMGCRVVVVTLGSGAMIEVGHGLGRRTVTTTCYLTSGEESHCIEPVRAFSPCLGATGAGDAFAAGFLYGVIKERGLKECGRLGTAVALCSISQPGARKGLPTAGELEKRYHLLFPQ
jgi:ribokinase